MCITKRSFKMFVGAAAVAVVLAGGCGDDGNGNPTNNDNNTPNNISSWWNANAPRVGTAYIYECSPRNLDASMSGVCSDGTNAEPVAILPVSLFSGSMEWPKRTEQQTRERWQIQVSDSRLYQRFPLPYVWCYEAFATQNQNGMNTCYSLYGDAYRIKFLADDSSNNNHIEIGQTLFCEVTKTYYSDDRVDPDYVYGVSNYPPFIFFNWVKIVADPGIDCTPNP